ncbi:PQQ-dependent dehydrogenase, methanol/ethanol family [Pseudomonas capeferrum]|nr:PQQ-dependent dehydrogenase, methanol/ethanol family [Pseudomonas capeferrum]
MANHKKNLRWAWVLVASLWSGVQACASQQSEWPAGGGFGEQYFSPLEQINEQSVERLGLAWEYDTSVQRGRVQRGMQATPVMHDGVLFTSGPWGVVHAVQAATGKEVWRFDPQLDGAWGRKTCCDVSNRGVALADGKVYVGQLDGYLVSLDERTGQVLWKVDTLIDRGRAYTLNGAPQVAGDVVVIGNAGAEFGVRGYVTAYDLKTGQQRWRFFTVPGDPKNGYEHPELEMAAKTWSKDTLWESGGGGTVWDSMVYDPQLNLLYVGVGNGSPHPAWLRSPEQTDNLFLSSILAINPDTGRLVWYYQTTPGDSWDFTATQPMVLAELTIDNAPVPVLMQAPKNGFYYVLDRRNGKLLSAEKYVTATWAERVDLASGRPVKSPQGDYSQGPKLIYPSPLGGHNWMPMAFSPATGLAYIPVIDVAMVFSMEANWKHEKNTMDWGSSYLPFFALPQQALAQLTANQPTPRFEEYLMAWDPLRQKEVWRAPNSGLWNGGTLATAGNLVFQGTTDGHLRAYRATDGKLLKDIHVGTGIMAAPMSYEVDGQQYIAVLAGYGGLPGSQLMPGAAAYDHSNRGRLLAFKLDGGPTPLPEPLPAPILNPLPPRTEASTQAIQEGGRLFALNCNRCHGGGLGPARSNYPDLFNMPLGMHMAFEPIVLGGILADGGMASFADVLKVEQVQQIHAYLIDTAYRQRAGEAIAPSVRGH